MSSRAAAASSARFHFYASICGDHRRGGGEREIFRFFLISPLCRRPAGSRERGQQRDGQSDVPVLRRGDADAEDAEQRHHQVCFRGKSAFHLESNQLVHSLERSAPFPSLADD